MVTQHRKDQSQSGGAISAQIKESLNNPSVLLILGILAPLLIFLSTLAGFFIFSGN